MEFQQIIYAFALASFVSGIGALAWIIYDLRQRVPELESARATTSKVLQNSLARLTAVEKSATEKSSTALLARVDALDEAIGKLADTHRKFAGRMDRRYQLDQGREPPNPDDEVTDEKWHALRRAQEVQGSYGGPTR